MWSCLGDGRKGETQLEIKYFRNKAPLQMTDF